MLNYKSIRALGFLIILLIGTALPFAVYAQIRISAALDRSSITLEDEATISVSVSGSFGSSDPVAPRVTGLEIIQTGKSSQFQMINGAVTTSTEFSFTVVPSADGEFTIPAFSVFSGGIEYKSNLLKLVVTKAGSYSSQPQPGLGNPFVVPGQPQQVPREDNLFWITTTVSKTNPKIYEQVIFKFKLYARGAANITDLLLPKFQDFLVEDLVPERKGREVVNGLEYNTYEIVYALFPLKTGSITIEDTTLKLRYYPNGTGRTNMFSQFFGNDPFMNRRDRPQNKNLNAPQITLHVEDLPDPTPRDFTNLVGKFSVQSETGSDQVQLGDSLTYTITITGTGNIKDAVLPEIKLENAKSYPDKPVTDLQHAESGVSGSKTFKMAIVPAEEGDFKIPAVSLSYFDPDTNRYESLTLEERRFTVLPGDRQDAAAVFAGKNESVTEDEPVTYTDLAPLFADADQALRSHSESPGMWAFYLMAGAGPGVFIILLVFFKIGRVGGERFRDRRVKKSGFARAFKNIADERVAETDVLHALRECFAPFSQAAGKSLTAVDFENCCLARGIAADDAREFRKFIEELEASQFGFGSGGFAKEKRQRLTKLLQKISGKMK